MVRTSATATITFRSDLTAPFGSLTGVVHGVRYINDGTTIEREQSVFCWVRDFRHIVAVEQYLTKRKFDEASLVFVPYSTRENWIRRYPLAVPTLECTKEGVIVDRERSVTTNGTIPTVKNEELKAKIIPTVSIKIEKRTRREFDDYLRELIAFKEEHGHVDVPTIYEKDRKLGKWVNTIRMKMKALLSQGIEAETPKPNANSTSGGATILTEDRIEQLDALGFSWECEYHVRTRLSWDDRFQELCEYYQIHGHWPPRTAGTIGEWAHKQKTKEVKGDKAFMEKHYAKLDSVGFPWRVKNNSFEPY